MDKNNLIKIISIKSGLKRNKCEAIFDAVISSVSNDLVKNKFVSLNNFGEFRIIRTEAKVQTRSNKKIIHPPSDSIEFILSDSRQSPEGINDIIFFTFRESFKKNRIIFIPKFGEFKTISSDKVLFKPSKKLQKKINYNFGNLEIVEIEFDEDLYSEKPDEFEYKMSEEFKIKYKEICNSDEANDEKNPEKTPAEVKKKLISDELIKLHHEITDCNS